MKKFVILTTVLSFFAMTGCIFKPAIQQGNILEQKEVNKIAPGMTKEQIAFILGNPVLDTNLQSNTWYYLYSLDPSVGESIKKRLILTFNGEVLESMEGTIKPQPKTE